VIKASLAYLVIAWVLLQVFQFLLPMLGAPEWLLSTLTLIIAIGLPIWIIISWIYEITPEGIEKTAKVSENELVTEITNKRLNVFIIVSLSIAVIVLTLKLTNVFSSDSNKLNSIAILPFDSMIVDEGNEWLSAGFTLDVNTYLSKIKNLHVTSLNSSEKYKDSDKTNPEIAEELVVSYLLRGTVRQVKNKVIVTVRLIDTNSDQTTWTKNFEDDLNENALNVQQEVSQKIVELLKIELSPKEEKILGKFPTDNIEAFKLYSDGRLINDSREKEDLEKNIALNKQAIELDSSFAEAYAEVGQATFLLGAYYQDYGYEWGVKNAIPYLEKALQLDPNNAMVYGVKGMMSENEDNWKQAQEYFEKAVAISPSAATIHYQYAKHLSNRDANKQRIHTIKAHKLDPLSAQIGHLFFAVLINDYKVVEAEQYYNKYDFLFTNNGEKLDKESVIIAYKNKDWTARIRFFENELKKDPDNVILNRMLVNDYIGVSMDFNKAIKYTKRAYALDSTSSDNANQYFSALSGSKKYKEAKKLMESENFKALFDKQDNLEGLFWYYYNQENYKKAQVLLLDSLMPNKSFKRTFIDAQLGNRKAVESSLKTINYFKFPQNRAFIYAILQERDSMYYYMEKILEISVYRVPDTSAKRGFSFINSDIEFDPYRKEDRFKAFLKKHYLPITHWNE
jgi:TolB-like protein